MSSNRLNRTHVQRRVEDILGSSAEDTISTFDPRYDRNAVSSCKYIVPDHQRHYGWNFPKKGPLLVDTVMEDFPMPSFIISLHKVGDKIVYHIQDGQQRLVTLQKFMLGEYSWRGIQFSELSRAQERIFLGYILQCEIIEDSAPMQIADIFERINSSKPLTSNDKYHNMLSSSVLTFIVKTLMVHPELSESFAKFIPTIGAGKARSGLQDIVGAVIPIITNSTHHIRVSYEVNGCLLGTVITPEMAEKITKVFKKYFRLITETFEEKMIQTPKKNYGLLSGALGLFICDNVMENRIVQLSDDCWKWFFYNCQDKTWLGQFFSNVDGQSHEGFLEKRFRRRLTYLHDEHAKSLESATSGVTTVTVMTTVTGKCFQESESDSDTDA